ncbi:MAG TPA: type II toxin-antitoxin system RelE/ParE family toxin [Smithellaceae bacterium]|nr:type II toxin-antitoxin system RelE/ParE family toxin [Smithellaceae bacterium]
MKKSYNVWWSETAENDLLSIIEYIARDNPLQARKIFGEIKKRTESLYAFPDRGRMIPELQNQGITLYRELIIGPWRVMYRVSEDSVYVLSVLDSRKNVEDILLQRLIALK